MEALFGTAAPIWSPIAPMAPLLAANGPLGGTLFASSPGSGVSSQLLTGVPQASMSALAPGHSFGYGAGLFAAGPPGLLSAPAASAVLATVAMRRGQLQGPANDQEIEEFVYDALELLPGAADVDVRCDGARVTLTGTAPNKRVKHDAGEIAWAIPALHDVQNNVTVASRRRARASNREAEPAGQARKQA